MPKPKRPIRTKQQLQAELEHKAILDTERDRQRAFVRDQLYPTLIKHSKSIENAKFNIGIVLGAMQNAYRDSMMKEQQRMSGLKLEEIKDGFLTQMNIIVSGDTEGMANPDSNTDLFELFKNETLATTEVLLQGIVQEIDASIKQENLTRGLDSLKLTLLS